MVPLRFEQLLSFPEVVHGVFTRHGGVSFPPFDALNLGGAVGDDPEHVFENRERVRLFLSIPQIVYAKQVHGTRVRRVSSQDLSSSFGWTLLDVEGCDALFTTEHHVGLAILHADCQAAIFYDPKRHALGLAHAGWRGSVQNIYARLILAMKEELGTEPADLRVCISPSLGPNFAEYVNFERDFPPALWQFQVRPNHFHFWSMSRSQLEQCGILPHHIEQLSLCTYSQKEDFFSYRRDSVTGRHATIACLLPTGV